MTLGIYIHVPFCRKKCDYCSFYSVLLDPATVKGQALLDTYMGGIGSEIRKRLPRCEEAVIDTIYFGGGTPSMLSYGHIRDIIALLNSIKQLSENCEVTVECNPEDVSREKLSSFYSAGVTRMVLGVQTLDAGLHRTLGRSGTLCSTQVLDDYFCVPCLTHCVDVITGIPGQTREALQNDLAIVSSYRPEHISAYLLSVDRGTPLGARMGNSPPGDDMQRDLYQETIRFLTGRGYRHYEISNFAFPGYESRHNVKYWRFRPYLGLGPGAHSFYGNKRWINSFSVDAYLADNAAGPVEDVRCWSDAMVEYILTGLRMRDGISLRDMTAALKMPVPDSVLEKIGFMERNGMVRIRERAGDRLVSLSDYGIVMADRVIYEIVEEILT